MARGGGRLLVRVEDSGEGFDVERALNAVERQERLCGRGLRLIRELSDRCQWSADGKVVSVEFFWSPQA
ncbi:ATP-binding protein [Pseudomonas aeruginosa]|nr:ATP-binding protein [Pseudomonas aeruginosa]MEB5136921.1 ATP-binding protein [Pseudomonas aeruginosa]